MGGIENALTPVCLKDVFGFQDGFEFGMGKPVPIGVSGVMGAGNYFTVNDDNGADCPVSLVGGDLGLFDSFVHEEFVLGHMNVYFIKSGKCQARGKILD